jgi:hypothetical protein
MTVLLLIALAMIAGGFLGRGSWLDSREHPLRFIFFWLGCGWITLTVLLLALLDILLVRTQSQAARRALRDEAQSGVTPPEQ